MAIYMIGDVQGCDTALQRLLAQMDFSPSRDTAYLLGDLVNRGPDSLGVLRRAMAHEGALRCLLGNHDLHLLAITQGVRAPHRGDTLQEVLAAPDLPRMVDWLRRQPLALAEHGWLMVHAGVLPPWSTADALALAAEVQEVLGGADWGLFMREMYGNQPDHWDNTLQGVERLRVVVNALTRLRLCDAQGRMDFETKDSAAAAPPGFMPWFAVPGRRSEGSPVAFGHWSTLGLAQTPDVLALDTGCVWGGCLSAARLGADGSVAEVLEVRCEQAQVPGRKPA